MVGSSRGKVRAGWWVAALLIVLVAGCDGSPGLARRKPARRQLPPRGGDPSARIAALIRELDQIEASGYGMMGGEDPKNDPIVVDLIAEGEPAIDLLLAALETDNRLTRTTLWHHGDARGVVPVSSLVYHALKRLMKTNRFSEAGQFSPQSDQSELKTPEGRKRLAGLAREFWRKNRGVPLGERFYRDLADDDAPPLRWVEAAAGLVAPAKADGVPDVTWVTLDTPTRAAPGQPRHGDAVKDRVPSVSELLALRASEMAGDGPARSTSELGLIRASKLGLFFVSWDERAALPTIKMLGERNLERSKDPKQRDGHTFYSEFINQFSAVLARSGEKLSTELPVRENIPPPYPKKKAPKPPPTDALPVAGGRDADRAGNDEKPVLAWEVKSEVIGGHNVLTLEAPAGKTLESVTWEIEGTIAIQEIAENGFFDTPLPNPLIDRPGPGTTEATVSFSWDGSDGNRSLTAHAEMTGASDAPPDGDAVREEGPGPEEAGRVKGIVIDEAGRPVAGATVGGQWRQDTPGWTLRAVVEATTSDDGTFQLDGIQPGAKVAALWARHGDRATVESPRARAGQTGRVTLRLVESGTLAITGRVVGPDGRPVAGAVVNVFHRTPYVGGNGSYGGPVRFDGSAEVRTGPDGTYRTPKELRRGIAYRVEVADSDRPPARGPLVELEPGANPTREFADIRLGGPVR